MCAVYIGSNPYPPEPSATDRGNQYGRPTLEIWHKQRKLAVH